MQHLVLILHVLICVVLVVIVLLQSGKEGMGVIFGGGSSSLFGGSGAGGLLAKITAVVAAIFLVTSLSYTAMTGNRPSTTDTLMDSAIEKQIEEKAQEPQGIVVDDGKADTEKAAPAASGEKTSEASAPAKAEPAAEANTEQKKSE